MNNKILSEYLEKLFLNNKRDYIQTIVLFFSLATLQTKFDDNNSFTFFKEIIDNFNRNIEELSNNKDIEYEFLTALSLIENYIEIPSEYKIETKMFQESNNFYEKYLKDIMPDNKEKIYLSRFQQELFESCLENNNYLYAMPTSFGKSFIIRLISLFRSNQGKRTIICVPTLALLNEYRIELDKINFKKFKISSFHDLNENFDILVTTQERLLEFNINKDDMLIIDESYSIDDKDLRSAILKSLAIRFLNNGNTIKLFQPNIIKINSNDSDSFFRKFNFHIKKFNFSFCTQDEGERISSNIEKSVINICKQSIKNKEKIGIYVIKNKHYKYAKLLMEQKELNKCFKSNSWYKILAEIYTEYYLPINFISKGILINNGELPKFFRFVTENIFKNNMEMFVIICNNTLTKGINFSLKNIVIQSKNGINEKGKIDEFEIKNLIGRVGRYSKNNLNTRIGTIYIVLSNKETIDEISKIKNISEVNYSKQIINENAEEKEAEKRYNQFQKDIDQGKFEPWKFILKKFNNNENEFKEYVLNNSKSIMQFYSKKNIEQNDKENFYDFIIGLFGTKEEYIRIFFNNRKKEISQQQINYYINRTKKVIFKHIFEDIPLKDLIFKEISYYKKNNLFFNKNNGTINKWKENLDDNWISINDVKTNTEHYNMLFTNLINKLSDNINTFYSANYSLIEPKIIEIIKDKYKDFEIKNEFEELDILMDKYNLLRDFRNYLIKNKIIDEQQLNKSEIFALLKEIRKI